MFDMRLGLALGKSLQEIRALPYPEILQWRAFYMLEPFGWHNTEFLVAEILAMLYNLQQTKRSKQKKPANWIRNMSELVKNYLRTEKRKANQDESLIDTSTEEGKQAASEYIIKQFQAIFGDRVVRKK